jgi:short subunit dehydrogenase-like uncharacterized protein
MTVGIGGFFALAAIPPTRALLRRALPAPGEGPSKEARDNGFFIVKLVGIGVTNGSGKAPQRLLATVRGQSDPGYGETAKMLSVSAVCLAQDGVPDGASAGGVLTPAAAMGTRLLERLRRVGMTFDVEEMHAAAS